jgi:hypothetical protein
MPVIFEAWRNQQELSNYPFADWATLGAGTPAELSTRLFIDAVLHPIGAGDGLYLSKIDTTENKVIFTVSDESKEVATGVFDPADLEATDTVVLHDASGREAGVLVGSLDELRSLASWSAGARTYSYSDTGFVPSVVVPLPQSGVRGFILESGEIVSGDCWLIGEGGVVLSVDDGAIRIDLIGDVTSKKRACEQLNAYQQPWFLRTINAIGPSKQGVFNLLAGTSLSVDSALRIVPEDNGLSISLSGSSIHAAT